MEIISYLSQKGLKVEREGSNYALKECPVCAHKNCWKLSSDGFFKCFSCGIAGRDQYKLESLLSGISYHKAKAKLTGQSNVTFVNPLNALIEKNHQFLLGSESHLKWLTEQRKIALPIIRKFNIGCYLDSENRVIYTFPYFEGDQALNAKHRTADKSLLFQKKDAGFYTYNYNVIKNADKILIVEGEMDVLAAYTFQLGIPTISFGLGANNLKDEWLDDMAHIKQFYIWYDSDTQGQNGAKMLAEKIDKRFGQRKSRICQMPPEWACKDLNDALIMGVDKTKIDEILETSLFLEAHKILQLIDQISDSEEIIGEALVPALKMIAATPIIETEDYIRAIRAKFPQASYQQVIDMRGQIKFYRSEANNIKPMPSLPKTEEIPAEIKAAAMEWLKSPDLLSKLGEYLNQLGLVGEDNNKICLFLVMLTRKLNSPASAVVFGQSSSGKSEMIKKVLSLVPEDETFEYTSMSARSLEYRTGQDLCGKVIFIAEYNGAEELEYVIRIAQSEGKLVRATTIKDETTGEFHNTENSVEVKSSFIISTTKQSIHNENNTRVWSLFADESIGQTKRVLESLRQSQSRDFQLNEPNRKRIREIIRAAQKLLKQVDVVIPWASHLRFPEDSARNRRDFAR